MYFTLPLNLNLDHGSYEVSSKQHWDNKFDYDKNLLHLTRIRTIGDALGDGVRLVDVGLSSMLRRDFADVGLSSNICIFFCM